jgi:uncharacterized protein (DUF885 family)
MSPLLRPLAVLAASASIVLAVESNPAPTRATSDYVPDVAALATPASSELRELVERFVTDRAELERFYSVKGSTLHARRMHEFFQTWQDKLAQVDFDKLSVDGRIDHTLLRTRLSHELRLLDREAQRAIELAPLLPFAEDLARLQETRRTMEPIDAAAAAKALDAIRLSIERAKTAGEAALKPAAEKAAPTAATRISALRAANRLADLQKTFEDWFKFYDGYDPAFGWWTREPHKQTASALDDYQKFLREKVAGIDPKAKDEPIIGDPIGREGLMADLENEMIAYTPEELIAIAEREFAWVDTELKRAARDMGCGDDWKAALEKVKEEHVAPGDQPALIRDLALEATRYVRDNQLVTVPPLASDLWRMLMLSPEQQKTAPFFLGGNDILVAFPTDSMTEEEKISSLRANNRHFARATVFHELVPGHHLQFYWRARTNQHRDLFSTPFWVEGWSLWWEFYLWDRKFISTPADRIGALFWRAHRCARIIFSLKFHLGEWTPQQCVDFLVDRVGHERASATGEVRRSFNGQWSPLYQAGYMLGALQIRELHRTLVDSGRMTDLQFHDTILRGGTMPIEMVRVLLLQEKLPRDFKPTWRFAN